MSKPTTMTTNTDRIQRTSGRIIIALRILLVAVPILTCLLWVFINDLSALWQDEVLPQFVIFPLPTSARILGFTVSLIPLTLFILANLTLIRLFKLYTLGQIFTQGNVRCFAKLSKLLIGWSVAGLLVDPLQSVALTLHHPAGSRTLSVSISSDDVTILLVGVILAVISWVMEEARKINEDQELTI